MYWLVLQVVLSLRLPLGTVPPLAMTDLFHNSHSAQVAHADEATCRVRDSLSRADFEAVMKTVSAARQDGDARKAADCFAEDAVYSSPPARPHQGREKLFQLFGGERKPLVPTKIEWHHLVFDPDQQVGAAEFTLQQHLQSHGVVIMKMSHGLISNWREYDVASGLNWVKFVGLNAF